jgi:hypothetical protein
MKLKPTIDMSKRRKPAGPAVGEPWALFLDDQRSPRDNDPRWVIARSVEAAIAEVEARGMPELASLDFDLGYGRKTGLDFARWLVAWMTAQGIDLWNLINFNVHSQHPTGRIELQRYLGDRLQEAA